jgi:hypothetical protein
VLVDVAGVDEEAKREIYERIGQTKANVLTRMLS